MTPSPGPISSASRYRALRISADSVLSGELSIVVTEARCTVVAFAATLTADATAMLSLSFC